MMVSALMSMVPGTDNYHGVLEVRAPFDGALIATLDAATADTWEAMAAQAKEHACPLVVRGADMDELAELTAKVAEAGVNDLVIDSGARGLSPTLRDLTQFRRLALRRQFRPVGYPALAVVTAEDPIDQVTEASAYISKYAAVVLVDVALVSTRTVVSTARPSTTPATP